MNYYFSFLLFLCVLGNQAQAQAYKAVYKANGTGNIFGYSAKISVRCDCQHTGSWDGSGDYIKCSGVITSGSVNMPIYYEGYTALVSLKGNLRTPQEDLYIGVIDNTGGRFLVYSGHATLGPPDEYGAFFIKWQQIK